jgi:hypothetical protein
LIPSADASSPSTGLEYPSTPMSPSLRLKMLAPSMSSAAASPVRTSAELAARRALPESAADFGLSLLGSLASYDPASCSWKTSQTSLFGGLTEFSETWPRSGMLRSGTAYQLAPLAPLTNGIESGLLPTPTSGSGRTGAHHPFDGGSRARAKPGRWACFRHRGHRTRIGADAAISFRCFAATRKTAATNSCRHPAAAPACAPLGATGPSYTRALVN